MPSHFFEVLLAGVFLAAAFAACATTGASMKPEPAVVSHVDLQRYLGTWYEIARYPNRFQRDCFASTANYTLRPDGDIEVQNTCRKGSATGPLDSAKGKAWVVDPATNAKLKVRFFWPFSGDYWILELDSDYRYVVVGSPDYKYLWILCREPSMDPKLYNQILDRIRQMGFDPDLLIRAAASDAP